MIVAYILAKFINIPTKIATLIGVGSSICGGSAIAATAPVIDSGACASYMQLSGGRGGKAYTDLLVLRQGSS